MEDLIRAIESFESELEQEIRDRDEMVRRLRSGEELLTRENASAHLTASAWVCNATRDRVLMCYHKIYDSWSWLGGHADGESDLAAVAVREVREESGLSSAALVSPAILSLEICTVDGHVKRGAYVSSHLHLNVTYLVEADEEEPLTVRADENAGLKWFSPEAAIAASSEPWFRTWVYPKLNERMRRA